MARDDEDDDDEDGGVYLLFYSVEQYRLSEGGCGRSLPSVAAGATAAVASTAVPGVLVVVLLGAGAVAVGILGAVVFGWGALVATALGVKRAATGAVAAAQKKEQARHADSAGEASVASWADATHPVGPCLGDMDQAAGVAAFAVATVTERARESERQGHGSTCERKTFGGRLEPASIEPRL